MPKIKRDVPWLNIVKFHKDIASRAEESFFSLPIDNIENERWSSINKFNLDNFAGPWQINKEDIVNNTFLRTIKMNDEIEIFIGGPCWPKWKKNNYSGNFHLEWQPLLYREVKVIFDGSKVSINPNQGRWEISPLLFNWLEQHGITPERPLEELMPEFLERAYELSDNGMPITENLVSLITKEIPELSELLYKDFPEKNGISKPSQWILFNSPTSFSAYTQNLIKDYTRLENILESDENKIGGLKLLEDIDNTELEEDNIDILPIVPLNKSQKEAVEGILSNKHVTVVSGPPGCGKSQVVLSVLLNAWANGKSVLFVSNNNQAVDVVRNRLESFEQDFPIAVRAGSKKVSNLGETLRRVINGILNWKKIIKDENINIEQQKKITLEKNNLEKLLNSQIPQRIDQLVKSALSAYANSRVHLDNINKKVIELKNELASLGYECEPENFQVNILDKFENWLSTLNEHLSIAESDKEKANELNIAIMDAEQKRNETLQSNGVNIEKITSFNWLLQEEALTSLNNWYSKFKSLLTRPIEQELKKLNWEEEFNQWNSEEEVADWLVHATGLSEDIREKCTEISAKVVQILALKEKLNEEQLELKKYKLEERIIVHQEIFAQWLEKYTELTLLPENKLDWLPWSNKNKIVNNLKRLEASMRPQFPLSIWKQVGALDESGREKLSEFIEIFSSWINIKTQWDSTENDRIYIEKSFGKINSKLSYLNIETLNDFFNTSSWLSKSNEIRNKIVIAQRAREAFKSKEKRDKTVNEIRTLSMEYKSIGIGTPIKEGWIRNKGQEFNETILEAGLCIEEEDIINLRHIAYSGVMDEFIIAWTDATKYEKNINDLIRQLALIPALSSRARLWWDNRPKELVINITNKNIFPKEGDELYIQYNRCINWLENWNKCNENIIKKERENYFNEVNWAKDKLIDALELIPNTEERDNISKIINSNIEKKDGWEVDQISKTFINYRPERIQARLDSINSNLEEISFNTAKVNRLKSLSEDVDAQNALEVLYNTYIRNNEQITDSVYLKFKEALRAVPIWITTAQSPQSIPMLPDIFDVLVVDEATQCTLTNILPLIYRAKRIAVIGDPEQLPAIGTIGSAGEQALAAKYGVEGVIDIFGHYENDFYKTAVRCLPKRNGDVISLNEHYRSHPLIIGFSNCYVYNCNLILKKSPEDTKDVPFGSGVFGKNVTGNCIRGPKGDSWINLKEVEVICEIVKELKAKDQFGNISIGIVSPFKAQVNEISDKLEQKGLMNGLTIGTVHKYQGDERDIMIFSSVVSKGITPSAARWVENPPNLINVAVTRARESLFVVSDFNVCRQQKGILGNLINYVDNINLLRKTSKYELDLYSWMIVQGWKPEVHPLIGDIEVDFVLRNNKNGTKIVIEVDGSQHNFQKAQDEMRDAFLISKGYNVLRFTTREIIEMPAEVINRISKTL